MGPTLGYPIAVTFAVKSHDDADDTTMGGISQMGTGRQRLSSLRREGCVGEYEMPAGFTGPRSTDRYEAWMRQRNWSFEPVPHERCSDIRCPYSATVRIPGRERPARIHWDYEVTLPDGAHRKAEFKRGAGYTAVTWEKLLAMARKSADYLLVCDRPALESLRYYQSRVHDKTEISYILMG